MVADFKASLMHVLEAICQQTELVLQYHVAMLSSLLPAVCEVRIGDHKWNKQMISQFAFGGYA